MNNKQKGDFGENIARRYLENEGMNILEKNYRIKIGEIDIIACSRDELIFVEVKSRTSISYGYPSEAVNANKINTIRKVASYYTLVNNRTNNNIRFDVIEVYLKERKLNHIINAF